LNCYKKSAVSNKCCPFERSVHQRSLETCFTVFTKILSSTTLFNIDDHHTRMISEGSCDTEDSVFPSKE